MSWLRKLGQSVASRMKNKSVMKVEMNCKKCRKKAMEIAAGAEGVTGVANEGKDKELITVVGISVDAVWLVGKLRKKVGQTELLSVTEVKEQKKEDKNEEKKEKKQPDQWYDWGPPPSFYQPPQQPIITVYDESPSICSVM